MPDEPDALFCDSLHNLDDVNQSAFSHHHTIGTGPANAASGSYVAALPVGFIGGSNIAAVSPNATTTETTWFTFVTTAGLGTNHIGKLTISLIPSVSVASDTVICRVRLGSLTGTLLGELIGNPNAIGGLGQYSATATALIVGITAGATIYVTIQKTGTGTTDAFTTPSAIYIEDIGVY